MTRGFDGARGGAESAGRDWYLRIQDVVNSTLVTDKPTVLGSILRRNGPSFLVGANPLSFASFAFATSRALKQVCDRVKPDLIHIHSYSGFVAFAPKGVPVLVTLHDEPYVEVKDVISPAIVGFIFGLWRKSEDFMRWLLLSRKPHVQATGSTTANLLSKRHPEIRMRLIPNPSILSKPKPPSKSRIDLLRELGLQPNARIILTVGTITCRKATHKILYAAELCVRQSNLHFIVVGRAANFLGRSYLKTIRKRAEQNRVSNFQLLGYVSDDALHDLFSHADVYVSPSFSEACNLALVEAAAYRIPIVATRVGASEELFGDEAVLLSRDCTAAEIVNGILSVIDSPRKDYEVMRNFTWDVAMKELLSFYKETIEGG